MELMDASSRMSPRQWAMENITCGLSSKKLNTLLKEEAVKSGTPWTQDIAEMQCRPHPTHAFPADRERLRPAYEDLHQRFPKVFGASLIDTSWR